MAHNVDALNRAMRNAGGVDNLRVIDGPRLTEFTPDGLADALEQELTRAHEVGWPKISIHLDLADARVLAKYLRRG